ncbi:MAG TPA: zinc ribbon domain-containing protein [Dehalococcoidia bacterium]|nr:zinc ribbon domain-containing protein [Dehalococcoidia bacterium]
MPVYEYYCPPCGSQFEVLRPMARADEPATCPSGHRTTNRVLSLFATFSKTADGEARPVASGCACGGACACGGHSAH